MLSSMQALIDADNGVFLVQISFCKPSSKYLWPGADKIIGCPSNFVMNRITSFTALGAIQFAYYSLLMSISPRLK